MERRFAQHFSSIYGHDATFRAAYLSRHPSRLSFEISSTMTLVPVWMEERQRNLQQWRSERPDAMVAVLAAGRHEGVSSRSPSPRQLMEVAE